MKRIYHLATCSTTKKILKILQPGEEVAMREIKTASISPEELDGLKHLAGSYEALFSRRAVNYREQGLAHVALNEADYRRLILEDYTFLKRPVVVVGEEIFIGNSPAVVAAAGLALHHLEE